MIGETFGNYRIVRRLGSGAMGTVFLGEHERIARSAAIKVLAPEFATNAEILGRFFDEARATSLIRHPAIVEILDCGLHPDGKRPYITMEYLRGETLADSLERAGSLPWRQACVIGAQIAEGLGAAHGHRIVHRDVKPANVMCLDGPGAAAGIAPVPVIKVLDFGVAKLLQDTQSGSRTHPGKLLGTPEYMAPEQCGAEGNVDARTDIYALGCVLYEMVSGNPPFPAATLNELIVAHRWREPPAAGTDAAVPPALEGLIARMLSKQQRDRPPDMGSVARALRDLVERPDAKTADPAPAVAAAATTRLGRAEASARSVGARRPPRIAAGARPLTVTLAVASLAAATGLLVHVALARRAPERATLLIAVPAAPRSRAAPEAALPPHPTGTAMTAPSNTAPTAPGALVSKPASPLPTAPAIERRARESRRGRAAHPSEVDVDGIVNL